MRVMTPHADDRLPAQELNRLRQRLAERGVKLREGAAFDEKLTHLRSLYEPYAVAIAAQSVDHVAAVDSSRKAEG